MHLSPKYPNTSDANLSLQDHSSSSSSSKSFPFEFSFHLGASESLDDEDHDGPYEDKDKTKLFPLEFFKSRKDPSSFRHHNAQTDTTKDTPSHAHAHDVNKPDDNAMTKLRRVGVDVFAQTLKSEVSWACLAGYDHVKQEIEETIVNSLKYPGKYDSIITTLPTYLFIYLLITVFLTHHFFFLSVFLYVFYYVL